MSGPPGGAGGYLEPAGLLKLLTWLSPSFPIGAYTCSHGLEWAVEAGDVTDAATLGDWIEGLLLFGSLRADAILLAAACRAAAADDEQGLREAAELAVALASSRERRLETLSQGEAFAIAVAAAWPAPDLSRFSRLSDTGLALPVTIGIAAAAHGLPLERLLPAAIHASAANLVSAGVRLIPLGQTAGLAVLARLEPRIIATADFALGATLDDIGIAALRSDISALRHETQHTRLFRT